MLRLTRLDGRVIVINSDLIEFVESTPDTLISLTTGKKIMVRETDEQIIYKVAAFRRMCSPLTEHGSNVVRQESGGG